jgi:hypothetical protein
LIASSSAWLGFLKSAAARAKENGCRERKAKGCTPLIAVFCSILGDTSDYCEEALAISALLANFKARCRWSSILGRGVLCKFLEVRVGAVLDLVSEKCGVAFLIVELALHIVAVECRGSVGLERSNQHVVGTLQQRVGGCRNPLALQDCIERIEAEAVCEAIAMTLFGCSSALAGPAARASSARAKPSIAIRVILETPRPTATAACWDRPISNRLAQYQRFQ